MIGHTDTVSRPDVPAGPSVTVALPTLPTTYDVNSFTSSGLITELAALTQPSAYLVDPYGAVALDTDVISKVTLITDPQKVVYRINPEATWSDGVPVSCQDFYLAWLVNVSQATDSDGLSAFDIYPNTVYDPVRAPRCSDGGRTVTVTFSAASPSWRTLFQGLLPAHIALDKAGISDVTTIGRKASGAAVRKLATVYNDAFGTLSPNTAVSAGPYVLSSADASGIVLTRNDKWWGNPAGPESIRLVAAEGTAVALNAVRSGEADVASLTTQDPAVGRELDAIDDVDRVARSTQIWPVSEHIEFNMRRTLFTGKAGKALRQAMFRCVDRETIIERVAREVNPDAEMLGNLMVAPWDPAYTDHYGAYRNADVVAAKKLLQRAGWKLGADGVFAHGKTKARFTLGMLPKISRTTIGKLVQQQCKQAGISIKVHEIEATDLFDGKFQAALFAWSAPIAPADYAYTYASGSGGNTTDYANPRVDTLFKQIASDIEPRAESGRLNRIDKLLAADQVVLPLYDWSVVNLQSELIGTIVTNNYFWGGLVWDAYAWRVTG